MENGTVDSVCDGPDVQIGLRCPDYSRRVLTAAETLLETARTDLADVAEVYHATSPTDYNGASSAQRYRDAYTNLLLCERTWQAAAAQYAATESGAAMLREYRDALECDARQAWGQGDTETGQVLFEQAALYDHALKRGEILRFAALQAAKHTGRVSEPYDCANAPIVLPEPVTNHGLVPLLRILGAIQPDPDFSDGLPKAIGA